MDEKPIPEMRTARVWSWLLFGAVSVYAAWALLRICVTQPNLKDVYADLGTTPPVITLMVSHAAYALTIPVLMLAGLVVHWRTRDRIASLAVNGILLVLVMLLLDIHLFGMFQPLGWLIDTMQSTGKPS
jgi:hypothetical protein